MTGIANYLDQLLFGALPYAALLLFLVGTIYRYRAQTFSYSSLSSQFLENRQHFWALVPFHYGILVVLAGHVAAFLLPRQLRAWNGAPVRLYVLEVAALAFGLLTLVGLLAIVVRRLREPKVRVVTSRADWVLYALLLLSVGTGIWTAIFHRWGASWFPTTMTPYLWSIAKLSPDVALAAAMPWAMKLHLVNAWLVIGFFPFTRLVHVLVVPNMYLWRKRQVVRWYGTKPVTTNH